ncbi:NAD-dependent epimerase/dehydratase family protein [Streptomyces lydicus]|nr:NAD-dependent epimerase/dehydratase family protein [Streptomyces lydicus]
MTGREQRDAPARPAASWSWAAAASSAGTSPPPSTARAGRSPPSPARGGRAAGRRPGAGGAHAGAGRAGCGPGTLTEVLTRTAPHVVVNAAGAVWAASEEEMARGNVLLVDRLLTVLPRLPRPPRLLQLGTVHEYGPPLGDGPVTEAAALRPVSGYGRTKARASEAVLGAARDGALEATVLRISNAVGAGLPRPACWAGSPRRWPRHRATAPRPSCGSAR